MAKLLSDPYKHGHRKLVMLRLMSGASRRTLGLCKTQKKRITVSVVGLNVFSSLAGESSSVFLLIPSDHACWHIEFSSYITDMLGSFV